MGTDEGQSAAPRLPSRPRPAGAEEGGEGANPSENHHGLPSAEVVILLQTDPDRGLPAAEAEARRHQFGPNSLPSGRAGGPLLRVLRQIHHPLVYVLLAAGALTAWLGEYVDSAVIFGVVLVNTMVGYLQEAKAEAALEALKSMVRTSASVIRDGARQAVPSEELVPGDLILLEAGDKVPADCRLVRLAELRVDESALTGESLPVVKDEVVLPLPTPVADRSNMVYSGTLVTAGTAAAVVVATGGETQLGRIHRLVGAVEGVSTPLTLKLAKFSMILTVAILALAAFTFGIGLLRGQDPGLTFTAAVALAVGAIPEGLPAAVTITLAIGVGRMARRKAVIRRLPAVETLGSTTVICSDKTGTFTENQMTVREIWTPGGSFAVSGSGYAPDGGIVGPGGTAAPAGPASALQLSLLAGALCTDADVADNEGIWRAVGDPTEAAMVVAAAKAGLRRAELADNYERLATIPFSSERQYMATLHRDHGTGKTLILAKGSLERLLPLCSGEAGPDGSVRALHADAALAAAERHSAEGLRVLATVAQRDASAEGFGADALRGSLVLTGLQAMLDPPRAAAASAVAACRRAGIEVKMITGDHASTAAAIGRQVGLIEDTDPRQVFAGPDVDGLAPGELADAAAHARVFARISPEQKLRLVESLQSRGQVVAMTGDGVNDAPALRQADIGIAMGRSGTEVAKEAADMVLTDDDFATIEAAVEEGRSVFDNLTKFIVWTLPTNMGEGLVILVAILLGTTLPILPTQILWINMTTAVALGLMLAFEPKEAGIMSRPPRDPGQPLLTGGLVRRVLLVSALLVAGAWWAFESELAQGASVEQARTAAVNLFVAVEFAYLISCRSLVQPAWRLRPFSNPWLAGGALVQFAGQAALTYLPVMNALFHTAPMRPSAWLPILGAAAATSLAVGLDKKLARRML